MKKLIFSILVSVFTYSGDLLSQEETSSTNFSILSEKDLEESILFNIKNSLPKYDNLYKQYQCRIIKNELNLSKEEILKLIKSNKNIFEAYFDNQIIIFYLRQGLNNKAYQEVEASLKTKKCFIEKASIINCKIDKK